MHDDAKVVEDSYSFLYLGGVDVKFVNSDVDEFVNDLRRHNSNLRLDY